MADRRSTYVYNQIAGNRRSTSPTNRTNTQPQQQKNDDNFFTKKGRSIENALGTTGSALYETGGNLLGAAFAGLTGTGYTSRRSKEQNDKTDKLLKDNKQSMEDIYKKYGYNSADDFYNASNKAEKDIFSKYGFDSDSYWDKHAKMWSPAKANDKDVLDLEATRQNVINRMNKEDADTIRKFDSIQNELKGQANKNAEAVDKNAKEYKDYVQNNYASKKINQDRGKFAGSAINTLSTATDVLGLTNGPVGNAIQGGIEGVADELEQNGLENFDWERAKQNAITGAASGAATGLVNGKIDSALAKNGGKLFAGSNALTRGLNKIADIPGPQRLLGKFGGNAGQIAENAIDTIGSGAIRGAVSGAVGGATGAGVNAALNNQDILSNALQGATQGAQQGLTTGGIMAGANMAINNTPGVGKFLQDVNQAQRNWRDSGDNFMDRLTNTVNSGDSAVGNFINDPRQSLQNLAEKLPFPGAGVDDTMQNAGIQTATEIDNPSTARMGENTQDPATELYRRFANQDMQQPQQEQPSSIPNRVMSNEPEQAIDLTDVFENNRLGNIEQRNKLQAMGQQLQNSAKTQKYAPVYDSLDAKTARRAAETGAPQQLADLGVKPQDYNEYAKTSSYVNQVVSDLAKKSGVKVNAPDLPSKLSADNIDVVMSDAALRKYNDYIKKIVPDGDSPTQYSASYLLEKSRELGNKAANLRGNTDDVSALRQALTDAKYTLRNIATDALEGSLVTGDATNDMIAQGLEKLGANEKVQDYYTNAVDGNAPTISDYIRRSSLFEQARDMGTQIDAEKYTRSASKEPTRVTTKILRASGLEQPLETLLRNTVAPVASGITNVAGKALEGAGNIIAGVKGGDSGNGGTPTIETASTPSNINATNPSTQLFNAIGRNEGLNQAEQARTAEYLIDSAQEAEIVPNGTETVQEPQATSGTTMPGATSVYNAMTSGQPQSQSRTSANTTMATSRGGFFPETGDYWTDMISGALDRAADANDVTAFAALYGMYQNALSNAQAQQEKAAQAEEDSTVKLNATQQAQLAKLNSANSAIDELEGLFESAGGGKGPILGNLQSIAGDWGWDSNAKTYNDLAEGLVNQISAAIGKTDSLNTEGEVQRALKLIPQLTDDAQTAKNKLEELRRMLADTTDSYNIAYGLAE